MGVTKISELAAQGETPNLLNFEGVQEADLVITHGMRRNLPRLPRQPLLGRTLDDPKGQDLETMRRIVKEINSPVRMLLAEAGIAVTTIF